MEDDRILMAKERTDLAEERNRMANERTFLAWVRTGLASVGGGVAMARLMTFVHPLHQLLADIVGIVLMGLGILLFIFAYVDFKNSYQTITAKPSYAGSLFTITAITTVLILVSAILLLFSAERLFG